MAISLLLGSITDAIADLNISGVTVKDVDEISPSWVMTTNVLYPNPEGFLTGFSLDYPTILRGADAPVNVTYTLNYRFLGTQIGDLSNMSAAYSQMVDKVILIINAIMSEDAPYAGTVEMELQQPTFGARIDPAGNGFHGADFAIRITEMQNA